MTSGLAALEALRVAGRLPSDTEAARAAGRELAREVGDPRSTSARAARTVEAMVRAGLPRLAEVGVNAEVLRARANCVVVRSVAVDGAEALHGCAFVTAWLEVLPQMAHRVPGTVVESSCRTRGEQRCIHTLLWQEPGAAAPLHGPARKARPAGPPAGTPPAPTSPAQPTGGGPPPPCRRPPPPPPGPPAPPVGRAPAPPPPHGGTRGTAGTTVGTPAAPRRRHGRRRRPWLRRRSWLLVAGLVVGSAGGAAVSRQLPASYSATAVLVVRSGASTMGPGNANDAQALAVTDAALMPKDQTVMGKVAGLLHVPAPEVSSSLSVQAEAGTSLMEVRYTAPSAVAAVAGANAVVTVVSGTDPDQAIPNGSLAVVSPASSGTRSGSVLSTGLPIGAMLGLLVGAIAGQVVERSDQQIDDGASLSELTGGPVTVVPGGISPTELAVMLDRSAAGRPCSLVPLRSGQVEPARQLARELAGVAAPTHRGRLHGALPGTAPFLDAPDAACRGEGPTVLVVGGRERRRAVADAVCRLGRVERRPVWAVLVAGR